MFIKLSTKISGTLIDIDIKLDSFLLTVFISVCEDFSSSSRKINNNLGHFGKRKYLFQFQVKSTSIKCLTNSQSKIESFHWKSFTNLTTGKIL